jgi:uncharacterized protein (TIGR03382 family)
MQLAMTERMRMQRHHLTLAILAVALVAGTRDASADDCGPNGEEVQYPVWSGSSVRGRALGGLGDEALLVWSDGTVNATPVDAGGALGAMRAMPSDEDSGYVSGEPLVAGASVYLQVQLDENAPLDETTQLFGRIVERDGALRVRRFEIGAAAPYSLPTASWFDGVFVITWTVPAGAGRWDVVVARVTEDGELLDPEPAVVGTALREYPPLAATAAAGDVLWVAWNTNASEADIYGRNLVVRRLSADLVPLDDQLLLLVEDAWVSRLVSVDKRVMLLAADFEVGFDNIAILDRNGPVGPPRRMSGLYGRLVTMEADQQGGAVIVMHEDYDDGGLIGVSGPIRAHRVDARGVLDLEPFVELEGVAPVAAVAGDDLVLAFASFDYDGGDRATSRLVVRRVPFGGAPGPELLVGEAELTRTFMTGCEFQGCSAASRPAAPAFAMILGVLLAVRGRRRRSR